MSSPLSGDPQIQRYRELGVGVADVGIGRRPALLVVDFQCAFTQGALSSDRTAAALDAAAELLAESRRLGVEVIFLHVEYEDEDEIGRVWQAKGPHLVSCIRGGQGSVIDPRVGPIEGETVIPKTRASAFFGTGLDEILRSRNIDSLIVCGTSTSGCVRATVVDGAARDYPITVVAEAVDDRDPRSHRATLIDVQAKYGDVVTLAAAVQRLREVVGTPEGGRIP